MRLNEQEIKERRERAGRLVQARQKSGLGGQTAVCRKFHWNFNNYKAHESGRNGFGIADAKRYAKAYDVSLRWLNFGIGSIDDPYEAAAMDAFDVPIISWVSAGKLMTVDVQEEAIGNIKVSDLPSDGHYFALRVQGDSMDRISPPGSVIVVNLLDQKLTPNACYVIADAEGNASYKRYRPKPERFEPVSTNQSHEPIFTQVRVVGRVVKSILEM